MTNVFGKRSLSKRTLAVALIVSVLSACSSAPDEEEIQRVPNKSAQALYKDAKDTLNSGLYIRAVELLSAIDSRYPFGPLSKQVQMDLVYAYYQSNNTEQAIATIDRFIKLNPNHKDLDYMYYMRGLVHIKAHENAFQEYFGIDRADRDTKRTRIAYEDFSTLVKNFPDSKYTAEAQKRMAWLLNKMARYELKVANYYFEREAYLAAANRCKYVVEHFAKSSYTKEALALMVESYDKLGLTELKENTQKVLDYNK